MLLKDFTDPYSAIEAFIYDTIIAPALTEHIDQIAALIEDIEKSQLNILDVGCGGGQNAIGLLKRCPEIKLTGLDLSEVQINKAIGRSELFQDRSKFMQGDALNLPFEDNTFDVVYSIASIKHWPNKKKGLAECIRVLKNGGQLFIIEGDKSASWSDCKNFVQKWRLPNFTLPLNLLFFKSVVIANSLSPKEAENLLRNFTLKNADVRKVADLPALLIYGTKQ